MNTMTRMLATTAMAVAAGLTTVAAPASAAPVVDPAPKASAGAKHQTGVKHRERIAGYFRSPIACHRAGRIGEWQRRWSDYNCDRVFWGPRRGWTVLKVTTWGGPTWNHGGHHGNHGGPSWNHGNNHPGR